MLSTAIVLLDIRGWADWTWYTILLAVFVAFSPFVPIRVHAHVRVMMEIAASICFIFIVSALVLLRAQGRSFEKADPAGQAQAPSRDLHYEILRQSKRHESWPHAVDIDSGLAEDLLRQREHAFPEKRLAELRFPRRAINFQLERKGEFGSPRAGRLMRSPHTRSMQSAWLFSPPTDDAQETERADPGGIVVGSPGPAQVIR